MMFVGFIAIILISALPSGGSQAAEPCDQAIGESFYDIARLSQQIAPVIALTGTQDIQRFCQLNGYRDREADPLYKGRQVSGNGWKDSFVAAFDFREAAFLSRYFPKELADNGTEELYNMPPSAVNEPFRKRLYATAIERTSKTKDSFASDESAEFLRAIQAFELKAPDQQPEGAMQVASGKAYLACSELTLMKAPKCVDGLKFISEEAKAKDGVMLLPLWKEVTADPAYMKVYKRISLKIIGLLQSRTPPKSRLFDDLMSEFSKETKDELKAEDYAWKTMALLAAGGGNASKRPWMIGLRSRELSDFLWIMSNGAGALDRLSAAKSNFLYTFPKEVNNLCDYGKNYHFWMSAYLARETAKRVGDVSAAAAAAFTAEKGYQFLKAGDGREFLRPLKEAAFSTYNNNMRLDLSLSAAGAWFGADSIQGKRPLTRDQVDSGIRKTFEGAAPYHLGVDEKSLSSGTFVKTAWNYLNWKSVINPDGAFRYFGEQLGY